jgi:lactose/L-arabinose transport system substrate-binding protein
MFRKSVLTSLLSILVLSAIVLGACTPAAAPATAPAVAPTAQVIVQQVVVTPTPAPKATDVPKPKGKITLWGWSYDVMQSTGLIDQFKKEYPDIQVEVVTYKAGDTYQNLQLALTSGQGAPDVVQIENSHLAGFVDLGGLTDLTDRVKPYLDKMNAYKWVDAQKDGKYYAMPWDSGPVVMYYRRDVFEKAGLATEPISVTAMVSTWDGYLSTCKTIKEKTGLNCFANSKANNDARLYEIALWQQGLGYYDKDGKITVDSPENIATLEKLGEFWTAGVTSEEVPWTDGWYAELQSPDKPVASIVEASWLGVFLKTWIAGDTAGKWGVALMPAMKDGQPRAANDGGSTLAIPDQSKNKDAAWAFIEFMLGNKDSQLKQFAYSDFLPALETTYNDALFIEPDSFFKGQVTRKVYLDVAKQIPTGYVYGPKYLQMNGYVMTAIQKYATGAMTAADALKEAATTIRQQTGMK